MSNTEPVSTEADEADSCRVTFGYSSMSHNRHQLKLAISNKDSVATIPVIWKVKLMGSLEFSKPQRTWQDLSNGCGDVQLRFEEVCSPRGALSEGVMDGISSKLRSVLVSNLSTVLQDLSKAQVHLSHYRDRGCWSGVEHTIGKVLGIASCIHLNRTTPTTRDLEHSDPTGSSFGNHVEHSLAELEEPSRSLHLTSEDRSKAMESSGVNKYAVVLPLSDGQLVQYAYIADVQEMINDVPPSPSAFDHEEDL